MAYLDRDGWAQRGEVGQSVVALGGGHGLSATLRALRHITHAVTAVVTVADDGGSSGRLRREMDVLPPGDLRMALASLCEETEWGLTWRDVLQTRLHTTGPLDGHALGNLLISGLWQMLGDPVEGLDWVARLLNAQGRVLPMASVPLDIEAHGAVRHPTPFQVNTHRLPGDHLHTDLGYAFVTDQAPRHATGEGESRELSWPTPEELRAEVGPGGALADVAEFYTAVVEQLLPVAVALPADSFSLEDPERLSD